MCLIVNNIQLNLYHSSHSHNCASAVHIATYRNNMKHTSISIIGLHEDGNF